MDSQDSIREDFKPEEKKLMLFGRNVAEIPCFRSSILYGIGGGLVLGLARFMFTSQSLRSVNFSVYSFSLITVGYWVHCRYNYSKLKFEHLKMQELLRTHALREGTAEHRALQEEMQKAVEV